MREVFVHRLLNNAFDICVASSLACAIITPAGAQMSFPVAPMLNNNLMLQSVTTQGQRSAWDDDSENAGQAAPPSKPVNALSLTYKSSASRTTKNLSTFVEKTRAKDPAGAEQLAETFASTDIIGQIDSAMRTVGLRSDNVADAYALWWVSAWKATRGDNSTADSGTYQAVSAQARRGFSGAAALANANDSQKQEMAEALIVQAALIDAAVEAHANDKVMLEKVSSSVSQGAAASGLDLDKMTLTEDGFVPAKPRKKADASDAAGDDATALASADTGGTRDDSSSPNYALIAGAAGAGLGAAFLIGKAMGRKG